MTAIDLPLSWLTEYLPSVLPSCTSSATTRNVVLKPWRVNFGFVDDGEICGMPASL